MMITLSSKYTDKNHSLDVSRDRLSVLGIAVICTELTAGKDTVLCYILTHSRH